MDDQNGDSGYFLMNLIVNFSNINYKFKINKTGFKKVFLAIHSLKMVKHLFGEWFFLVLPRPFKMRYHTITFLATLWGGDHTPFIPPGSVFKLS